MKIFTLDVPFELQPNSQAFNYPDHNRDYGVEQDFFKYMSNHGELLTDNSKEADWHYLPIYWTRWHLNHDYGRTGLGELNKKFTSIILDSTKTFTICQCDSGPKIDTKETRVYYASRKFVTGYDIPLLSSLHRLPIIKPKKKYRASFVGRLDTNPIRQEMKSALIDHSDIYIENGDLGEKLFVKSMLQSYIALAPRGNGGSSFRFYEAMSLGVVPFLIGDIDTRPFKEEINWNQCSLYTNNKNKITDLIDIYSEKELIIMGKTAKKVFHQSLYYEKWCKLLLKSLED